MSLGVAAATPCVVLPPVLAPRQLERGVPLLQRYWVKANLWIAIFSFIGGMHACLLRTSRSRLKLMRLLTLYTSSLFPAVHLHPKLTRKLLLDTLLLQAVRRSLHLPCAPVERGTPPAATTTAVACLQPVRRRLCGSKNSPAHQPAALQFSPILPRCPSVQVPITLYLMTHAYFCLYHALANLLIRRVRAATSRLGSAVQTLSEAALVFALR